MGSCSARPRQAYETCNPPGRCTACCSASAPLREDGIAGAVDGQLQLCALGGDGQVVRVAAVLPGLQTCVHSKTTLNRASRVRMVRSSQWPPSAPGLQGCVHSEAAVLSQPCHMPCSAAQSGIGRPCAWLPCSQACSIQRQLPPDTRNAKSVARRTPPPRAPAMQPCQHRSMPATEPCTKTSTAAHPEYAAHISPHLCRPEQHAAAPHKLCALLHTRHSA